MTAGKPTSRRCPETKRSSPATTTSKSTTTWRRSTSRSRSMALASHTPATWNDILSTTMHNYHKTLTDNIFNTRPLLNYYMSKGRVKTLNGGISIVEPVMYAEGDADSYAEWDQVVVTPKNTATAAQYDWKQLVRDDRHLRPGRGAEQRQGADHQPPRGEDHAGRGDAQDAPQRHALRHLRFVHRGQRLPQPPDPRRRHRHRRRHQLRDRDVVGCEGGHRRFVDAAGLEAKLRNLYNAASDSGPDTTDAIFTNAYGFGFYESTLTPQVRYTDVAKANLGLPEPDVQERPDDVGLPVLGRHRGHRGDRLRRRSTASTRSTSA
jgi:hypothetical protein